MTVIVPSDVTETRMAVRAAAQHEGPVYLRLSRAEVTEDHGPDHPIENWTLVAAHQLNENIDIR